MDKKAPAGTPPAVDLDLEKVLGKMPDKTFEFKRADNKLAPLDLPAGATPAEALQRVLRLPSVCSKRFLTSKVDRHVTGERVAVALVLDQGLTPVSHASSGPRMLAFATGGAPWAG